MRPISFKNNWLCDDRMDSQLFFAAFKLFGRDKMFIVILRHTDRLRAHC